MAIVVKGPFVGFSGTVDGITYSQLPDGRTSAKRKNGPRTVPDSFLQTAVMTDTAVFAAFMNPLKDFVQVGYQLESRILKLSPYNAMIKSMRNKVLQGDHLQRSINFTKVLVTKGTLPAPVRTAAEMTENGLAFSWSTELVPNLTHHSDQVMMLAYFPELNQTAHVTSGAHRLSGQDLLLLIGIEKGYTAEVYISFITDNRKSIANSIYLGQYFW